MTSLRTLRRCTSGAGAAEFALVLPLLLILLFGIIDGGRLLYELNQAQKATQVGVRVAAVTSPLAPGLVTEDYQDKTYSGKKLAAGDTIPLEALGTIVCKSTGCTCSSGTCPTLGTMDSTLFNDVIVARMKAMDPRITPANVEVRYSGSGLGSAGDLISTGGGGGGSAPPEQMEIAPLITVSLTGVQFQPLTTLMLATFTLPDYAASLTAEDASGSYSN